MRIVSWNIQHLEQYDRSIDPSRALSKMLETQNADVLLLQEVDVNKPRTNNADQATEIANALGAFDFQFKETKLVPREEGQYGIAIVSKVPVVAWRSIALPRSPVGRKMTFEFGDESQTFYVNDHPRAALAAILENGYCIVNTHLSFMPIAAQLQMLKVVLWGKKIARQHNSKLIIGGDFNFVSVTWLKLFGLVEAVFGKTFPAWKPDRQIDHFLVGHNVRVLNSEVGASGPLSDHRWIAVELD